MAQSETYGMPVRIGGNAPRPSLTRNGTQAEFVSQLLAEYERLPPQRLHRRASVEGAIGAYSDGARMGERRLPVGYRKTVVI